MLPSIGRLSILTALVFGSCTRFPDAKLAGTWRTEDETAVEEIALRDDHTFTRWIDYKGVLTTPSVPTSAGEWHIKGDQLVVHFSWTNGPPKKENFKVVDGWAEDDQEFRPKLIRLDAEALTIKDPDESSRRTFRLISRDRSVKLIRGRSVIDSDVRGRWRVHFDTRDYELFFAEDHQVVDFAEVEGQQKKLHTGTWRIERNDELIADVKSVPFFAGESIKENHFKWKIVGIEPNRIAIKEGPIGYIMHRIN